MQQRTVLGQKQLFVNQASAPISFQNVLLPYQGQSRDPKQHGRFFSSLCLSFYILVLLYKAPTVPTE